MNNSNNRFVTVAATLLLTLAAAQPVHAASVGSGSASGHALDVGLGAFGGGLLLNVGPLPAGVSVTSPAPGSASDSVVGIDVQASHSPGLLASTFAIDLATGVLNATAASTVNGAPGPHTSEAAASVDDLDFAVGTLNLLGLISASAVDLSADTIGSTATVSGEPGSFTATGTTTLENASLDVAGLSLLGIGLGLNGMLVSEPDPNLVILAAAGITVTLNRQLVNGAVGGSCAVSHCDISVDAIAVTFEDFLLGSGGLLNGELVLGHSEASLSAVPVPAAAWLFGSGLVGLVGIARRRKAAA